MDTHFLILILALIAAVSILAKRLQISYTPLLVLTGLVLGLWKIFPEFHFSPRLLLTVLLPPLIFEGAIRISFTDLKKVYWGIAFLAGPGVILSILILGPVFHWIFSFSMPVSYLLAALLSATDPIAVLHTLRSLKIDRRLTTLVEGESLFNDGTAMVFFAGIFAFLKTSQWNTWTTLFDFVRMTAGGLVIGTLLGILTSSLTKWHEDSEIRITLSTILAYGSYIAADYFHCSGILSAIAAGVVYGNLSSKHHHPELDKALKGFWSYAAFLANSIVFLLIGTQINSRHILGFWKEILIVYGLLMSVRLIIVFAAYWTSQRLDQRFAGSWFWLTWWSGLRGALSLALAMSLINEFPQGQQVYFITLGVVFVFLFLNGLSTNIWAKKLNLIDPEQNL